MQSRQFTSMSWDVLGFFRSSLSCSSLPCAVKLARLARQCRRSHWPVLRPWLCSWHDCTLEWEAGKKVIYQQCNAVRKSLCNYSWSGVKKNMSVLCCSTWTKTLSTDSASHRNLQRCEILCLMLACQELQPGLSFDPGIATWNPSEEERTDFNQYGEKRQTKMLQRKLIVGFWICKRSRRLEHEFEEFLTALSSDTKRGVVGRAVVLRVKDSQS